jgi:hypothetical protein
MNWACLRKRWIISGTAWDFSACKRWAVARKLGKWAAGVGLPVLLFIFGLALSRLSYEALFPRWSGLARPFPSLSLAFFVSLLGIWVWRRRFSRFPASCALPLLLNLLWLLDPAVDLLRSRLIFAASLWLMPVLMVKDGWSVAYNQLPVPRQQSEVRNPQTAILLLWLALVPVYLLTLGRTVGRADTFEFQVVAPQLGIAHPTGYPLYLLLGKLWTELIPFGPVAWRLNLGTAVYALIAVTFLFLLGLRLVKRPLPALLAAVALGITPTFWSQAVEAEVYTLHALIVCAALWLMVEMSARRLEIGEWRFVALAILLGLGLTNHLTTLFLFPPTALILLTALNHNRHQSLISNLQSLAKLVLAFLVPLTLYAYLPLRWQALHGEGMGFGRFVDWVIGGRFQGALQWRAWLEDPTRYEIVGRLFLDNWGWFNLALAGLGFFYLAWRQRRAALLLFLAWFGFTFYALNYYVPDLDVFLMGAQVVVAVWWAAGAAVILDFRFWVADLRLPFTGDGMRETRNGLRIGGQFLLSTFLFLPILLLATATWPRVDRSQDDGLASWGTAVLTLPLAANSAILADSEKIAPLYYLQQVEGLRPDLNIMVLPDEAAYRAALDARIAAGQTVYLARYLPGLESIYHLRALGPLTEVSPHPLPAPPDTATASDLHFGPLRLLAYEAAAANGYAPRTAALILYWQATAPTEEFLYVYVRWQGHDPLYAAGQHPAHNNYPTLAWRAGEVVPDFYLLPHPISAAPQRLALQVAVAPPFTPAADLAWQTVTTLTLPETGELPLARPFRMHIPGAALSGTQFPAQIRPQTPLRLLLTGYGAPLVAGDDQALLPNRQSPIADLLSPISYAVLLDGLAENGRFPLVVRPGKGKAICGWLQTGRDACTLGVVEISGAPLPAGAVNFADKIALMEITIPDTRLQPGGVLPLTLTWQGLAPLAADYTVFVQVLDANDRIVGQVDAWPVQGTRPTSQWVPGQIITDPYAVQLAAELPPGEYRLIVGWYLLADLRRLPLLDTSGNVVDDRVVVDGLIRP